MGEGTVSRIGIYSGNGTNGTQKGVIRIVDYKDKKITLIEEA
jgi:Cu/Ag efflux protein CusF